MSKPNDKAREAMNLAADELEKLACTAEIEADTWRQAAEHMRRGNLMEASEFGAQASRACEGRNNKAVAKAVNYVEIADPEFYKSVQEEQLYRDLSTLPSDALKAMWHLHKVGCRDSECVVHRSMQRRIRELGL